MIPLHKVYMAKAVDVAVRQVLHSGFIGQGEKVDQFEKTLIPIIGRKTLLTTNSCTSAIQLALRLAGCGAGTETISTPVTCTATNVPVLAQGSRIVWSDVDPWTGNIDPDSVRRKITKKTKAVIAVHWGGQPCDLAELQRITTEYGLKLIVDAAHALGAEYRGEPVGKVGDYVCFSFQAIKHLTTGDGGLLVCKDPKDYERGKLLRWYGFSRDHKTVRPNCIGQDPEEWGYKFHMNDIAASIGLANLKDFPRNLKIQQNNAGFYADHLTSRVYHPEGAYWLFTIHSDKRNQLQDHLKQKGIASGVVHERNDRYRMFGTKKTNLPGVDAFCRTQLNIPVGWWVTKKDREHIEQAIQEFKFK